MMDKLNVLMASASQVVVPVINDGSAYTRRITLTVKDTLELRCVSVAYDFSVSWVTTRVDDEEYYEVEEIICIRNLSLLGAIKEYQAICQHNNLAAWDL